jgi:GGDEF domain-containing protein
MVYYRNKQSYILLGCGHLESRTYDPNLLSDLSAAFKAWSPVLGEAVDKLQSPGFVEEVSPVPVVLKTSSTPSTANLPRVDLEMITQPFVPKIASGSDKHRRPVVLVDEVTRLFNKDYFEECLGIEVERAKRYSREMSLVFLSVAPMPPAVSIDENHIATQIAEILYKSLRTVDIICRLDKHKYGIILPDTANNTYGIIAKRVFKFFKQVMGENPPIFLNISASTYPKHAGNHLLLFENAEKLLIQAQEVGPNKAVLPE